MWDYRKLIPKLQKDKQAREARKRADEARRKEEARLAKLCARCKKYPYGSMQLALEGRDHLNNQIMIRVCNGCYDSAYEAHLNCPGTRINLLPMRPGYKPPKFDTHIGTSEEGKALAAWFKAEGKIGEWSYAKDERDALGVTSLHSAGVLRYLHKAEQKVTKEQFIALLLECAAERPKPAEPEKAMHVGESL